MFLVCQLNSDERGRQFNEVGNAMFRAKGVHQLGDKWTIKGQLERGRQELKGKRRQRGTARRGDSQVGKGKDTRKGGLQDTAGGLRHPQKSRIYFLVEQS